MSALTLYAETSGRPLAQFTDGDAIARELSAIGVQFERWAADRPLADDADQAAVLAAYQNAVDRLNDKYGFASVDVVSLRPDNPKKDELRRMFLAEHTHADFEIRFFVDGSGLFYLHADGKVYLTLCEAGDLISVPADTPHWFDMGSAPDFKCIRFFTTDEGWKADFTGSKIAGSFPDYDNHAATL